MNLELHKTAYRAYSLARTTARALGISRILRRSVGPLAARLLYKSSENLDRPFAIQGHKMYLAPVGRYPSPDMLVDGYEQATTQLFRQLLKPGMVVVDVGANIGYFSLLAADLVGPTGVVYALEPEPENFALLQKNIELNAYSNIKAVDMAISNKPGTTNLFLSGWDTGSHSIFGQAARGETGSVVVKTVTLDALLEEEGWPQVDLVKIDVEGAEWMVLEGMDRVCRQSSPLKLILEFCPFLLEAAGVKPLDLLDRLGSMRFQVRFIDDKMGVLPPEAADAPSITAKLLKQETYMNLLCSRQ